LTQNICHSERSEEPPHLHFAVAVACLLHTIKKIISNRSGSQSHREPRSAEIRFFPAALRTHSTGVLHHDAHTLSVITILSTVNY
jgi:hypothetical protein